MATTFRYKLCNHLGSSSLELDDHARIISYEEFTQLRKHVLPRGAQPNRDPKRYRYTGKERDDENGLYYRTQYYAPWLECWLSGDPLGVAAGADLFSFVHGNPIKLVDRNGTKLEDLKYWDPHLASQYRQYQRFK